MKGLSEGFRSGFVCLCVVSSTSLDAPVSACREGEFCLETLASRCSVSLSFASSFWSSDWPDVTFAFLQRVSTAYESAAVMRYTSPLQSGTGCPLLHLSLSLSPFPARTWNRGHRRSFGPPCLSHVSACKHWGFLAVETHTTLAVRLCLNLCLPLLPTIALTPRIVVRSSPRFFKVCRKGCKTLYAPLLTLKKKANDRPYPTVMIQGSFNENAPDMVQALESRSLILLADARKVKVTAHPLVIRCSHGGPMAKEVFTRSRSTVEVSQEATAGEINKQSFVTCEPQALAGIARRLSVGVT